MLKNITRLEVMVTTLVLHVPIFDCTFKTRSIEKLQSNQGTCNTSVVTNLKHKCVNHLEVLQCSHLRVLQCFLEALHRYITALLLNKHVCFKY